MIAAVTGQRGRTRARPVIVLMVLLSVGLAVVGCSSVAPNGNGSDAEVGPVRTDREPIDRRYPQLAGYTAVYWVSGRCCDDRVPTAPGPPRTTSSTRSWSFPRARSSS